MALPSSGTISLNDCHMELGASSGTTVSMNDSDMRSLAQVSSGAISLSNFHGKANEMTFVATAGPTNGYMFNANVVASQISGFSSGMTLRIPSNVYIQAVYNTDSALTLDIPCTIINEGRIIGCGGRGGSYGWPSFMNPGAGQDGGNAINVTSNGVTIINQSSGYIAGGGGGGACGYDNSGTHGSAHYINAGGGGGAGGSRGGRAGATGNQAGGGDGFVAGPGGNGQNGGGLGGGAGGGGDSILTSGGVGGGGGGRILPGVGGGNGLSGTTANGGSAGAAGNGVGGGVTNVSGGGGGWGASGGAGQGGYFYGSGGSAIKGLSRTVTNNGTIYGST